MVDQSPSRFLHEIPPSLPHDDCSYWKQAQLRTFFTDWFGIKKQSSVMTFQGALSVTNQKGQLKKSITNHSYPSWKKNQPVIHKKYGTGIIKIIEKNKIYVTVLFKCGIKKILSDYLRTV